MEEDRVEREDAVGEADAVGVEDAASEEDAARDEDAAGMDDAPGEEYSVRVEDAARDEDAAGSEDAAEVDDAADVEDAAREEDRASEEDAEEGREEQVLLNEGEQAVLYRRGAGGEGEEEREQQWRRHFAQRAQEAEEPRGGLEMTDDSFDKLMNVCLGLCAFFIVVNIALLGFHIPVHGIVNNSGQFVLGMCFFGVLILFYFLVVRFLRHDISKYFCYSCRWILCLPCEEKLNRWLTRPRIRRRRQSDIDRLPQDIEVDMNQIIPEESRRNGRHAEEENQGGENEDQNLGHLPRQWFFGEEGEPDPVYVPEGWQLFGTYINRKANLAARLDTGRLIF